MRLRPRPPPPLSLLATVRPCPARPWPPSSPSSPLSSASSDSGSDLHHHLQHLQHLHLHHLQRQQHFQPQWHLLLVPADLQLPLLGLLSLAAGPPAPPSVVA